MRKATETEWKEPVVNCFQISHEKETQAELLHVRCALCEP